MQALMSAASKLEYAFGEYSAACVFLSTFAGQNSGLNSLRCLRNDLDEGLRMLLSLEEKTGKLKATLGKARNSISVPINFLPDEILARIFHLTASAQLARFEQLVDDEQLPVDVLATSQVCSRWRQIALNLPTLWNYINLSSHYGNRYISLGTIFSARSGNLPLSIRAVENRNMTETWDEEKLDAFFDEVGPRLGSMELALVPSVFTILERSLVRCVPEQLTRLTLSDPNIYVDEELPDEYFDSSKYWFIVHHNSPFPPPLRADPRRRPELIRLDTTQESLENILLHIKVLRLDRVYPAWTSKAYHGLVELRLIGPPQLTGIITESLFATILAASPKLRILHFGLEFIPTGTRSDPMRLEELEEFQLQSLLYATQQIVLRLILPSTKPLLMSTTCNEKYNERLPPLVEDEFCRFFQRSNIVQLHVHNGSIFMQLPDLLNLLPNLRTLVLRLVDFGKLESSSHGSFAIPLCPNLRDVHLISCGIDLEMLQWLGSTHDLRKLIIWGCAIREATGNRSIEDIRDVPVDLHPITQLQVLDWSQDSIKIEGWGQDLDDRMATASMKDYALY